MKTRKVQSKYIVLPTTSVRRNRNGSLFPREGTVWTDKYVTIRVDHRRNRGLKASRPYRYNQPEYALLGDKPINSSFIRVIDSKPDTVWDAILDQEWSSIENIHNNGCVVWECPRNPRASSRVYFLPPEAVRHLQERVYHNRWYGTSARKSGGAR